MKKKIVYVINHAAFFVSHRLPLAIAAREAGWEVHLLIGQSGSALMEPLAEAELKRQSIAYTRLSFRTVGFNPIWELIGMLQLLWHIARMQPSIVHTASPKGDCMAAWPVVSCERRVLFLPFLAWAFCLPVKPTDLRVC